MHKKHVFSLSIPLAIFITIIAIVYQRTTGPTYPRRFKATSSTGETIKFKLLRSQENTEDASLEIPVFGTNAMATVFYRRYPTNDAWSALPMVQEKSMFTAKLPRQPAAGKLQYYLEIREGGITHQFATANEPIYIRFKGPVPIWILAPHIFCMFLSMFFSSVVIVEALYRTERFYPLTLFTTGCLMIGGMILGPFVQKHAFGVYWAGFPWGYDLTDNKLLIGVIIWLFAVILNFKKRRPWASVIAAVVLILVYSIPHSRMGSEFNYAQGEVQTQKKF